jgi:hypothetical protein
VCVCVCVCVCGFKNLKMKRLGIQSSRDHSHISASDIMEDIPQGAENGYGHNGSLESGLDNTR